MRNRNLGSTGSPVVDFIDSVNENEIQKYQNPHQSFISDEFKEEISKYHQKIKEYDIKLRNSHIQHEKTRQKLEDLYNVNFQGSVNNTKSASEYEILYEELKIQN